jgi:malonyl-CoA O-methyltransferase
MNRVMQYPLDLVRKHFDQAAAHYDTHAVVQREIADRLLDHLEGLNLQPQTIVDVGCGTGYCTRALQRRYPRAKVTGIDLSVAMIQEAGRRRGWPGSRFYNWLQRKPEYLTGDAQALPLADSSVDLLISNLVLQWCDPELSFREFARVLKPGGLLLFSSFGPDTLIELRRAWAAVDQHQHVHTFIDMHDLGDAMVRSGLASPVLDVDRLVLTYNTVNDVIRDLKGIGAQNLAPERPRGLMGKQLFRAFCSAYESSYPGQALPVTYEAVYGHAWATGRPVHETVVLPMPGRRRRS